MQRIRPGHRDNHGAKAIVSAPSRNRSDILDGLKGFEIRANSIRCDGRHIDWHTTPEELERLARQLQDCNEEGEVFRAESYGDHLDIGNSSQPSEDEVEIRHWVRFEITAWTSPRRLRAAAKRLRGVNWVKQDPNCVYGSDFKSIKVRFGDDIVTITWTPDTDKEGVPQISRMVWDAWGTKIQGGFAQAAERDRLRHMPHHASSTNRH